MSVSSLFSHVRDHYAPLAPHLNPTNDDSKRITGQAQDDVQAHRARVHVLLCVPYHACVCQASKQTSEHFSMNRVTI